MCKRARCLGICRPCCVTMRLAAGFDLFFCDVDIPWASDISSTIAKHTELDFVAQHNWPLPDVNVGFFLARR